MCEHKNFVANVNVHRLVSENKTTVVGINADITIKCSDCGQPFEFIGVPAGLSPFHPMVSADSTELRAPIKAATGQLAFEAQNHKLN